MVRKLIGFVFAILLLVVGFVIIVNKHRVDDAEANLRGIKVHFGDRSKSGEPHVTQDFCEVPLSFKIYEGAIGPPLSCKNMKAGHLTATLTGRVIVEDSGETRALPWQSRYTVRLDVADKACDTPTPNCSFAFQGTKETSWPAISTLTVQTETRGGRVTAFVRFPICGTSGGYKTNCRFEDGSKLTMQID